MTEQTRINPLPKFKMRKIVKFSPFFLLLTLFVSLPQPIIGKVNDPRQSETRQFLFEGSTRSLLKKLLPMFQLSVPLKRRLSRSPFNKVMISCQKSTAELALFFQKILGLKLDFATGLLTSGEAILSSKPQGRVYEHLVSADLSELFLTDYLKAIQSYEPLDFVYFGERAHRISDHTTAQTIDDQLRIYAMRSDLDFEYTEEGIYILTPTTSEIPLSKYRYYPKLALKGVINNTAIIQMVKRCFFLKINDRFSKYRLCKIYRDRVRIRDTISGKVSFIYLPPQKTAPVDKKNTRKQ